MEKGSLRKPAPFAAAKLEKGNGHCFPANWQRSTLLNCTALVFSRGRVAVPFDFGSLFQWPFTGILLHFYTVSSSGTVSHLVIFLYKPHQTFLLKMWHINIIFTSPQLRPQFTNWCKRAQSHHGWTAHVFCSTGIILKSSHRKLLCWDSSSHTKIVQQDPISTVWIYLPVAKFKNAKYTKHLTNYDFTKRREWHYLDAMWCTEDCVLMKKELVETAERVICRMLAKKHWTSFVCCGRS